MIELAAIDLAALGAFLSGVGAVVSSVWAIRALRRRAERDCQRRIAEIRQAMHEGFEMGEQHR